MRKMDLIVLCFCISGCCSMPRSMTYPQLYSLTTAKKTIKKQIGMRQKVEVINTFRENEVNQNAITALTKEVDKYIAGHSGLAEATKNNLRKFKVVNGATADEVNLLLGKPDKVIKTSKKNVASETWMYQTSKSSIFDILVFPVFWGHEKYFLYFQDNILTLIERHYLKQIFTGGAPTRVK